MVVSEAVMAERLTKQFDIAEANQVIFELVKQNPSLEWRQCESLEDWVVGLVKAAREQPEEEA